MSRPALPVGRTRRERWNRLRRSLWQPPRPHGEQPHERVVGPLELFYDLAAVVLVAQAVHRLAGHLTLPGLGTELSGSQVGSHHAPTPSAGQLRQAFRIAPDLARSTISRYAATDEASFA
jgi:hypothetical protein